MTRPQVVAQANFLKHREALEGLSLEQRFAYIFEHNLWDSEESRSGVGSTLVETEVLRREIPRLLHELGARTLLDIPCGDFRWMKEVPLGAVLYTGGDLVASLVSENEAKCGSATRRFMRLDLTADPLPTSDVVLCRDCLVHLSFANIQKAFENLKRSGSTWLLTTSFPELETNEDIADGDWRALNFERAPFHLRKPGQVIVENCLESGGAFRDKSLCLWPIAELP
jgi:hypothetical protein